MVRADWVDDDQIRATIRATHERTGEVVCPHTACGLAVRDRLRTEGDDRPWVVAATAHAAKFAEEQPVPKSEDGLSNVFAEGAVPLHTT